MILAAFKECFDDPEKLRALHTDVTRGAGLETLNEAYDRFQCRSALSGFDGCGFIGAARRAHWEQVLGPEVFWGQLRAVSGGREQSVHLHPRRL